MVIDGMAMDLDRHRYVDFADLLLYCDRVAGVVGLMSAEIFGYTNPATRGYAHDLGIAFQLTNIIRDVGEDARRGRIYLPQDELARHGVGAAALLRREYSDAFPRADGRAGRRARAHGTERALDALPPEDRARATARAHHGRHLPPRCWTRSSATALACSTTGSR